MDYSQLSDEQLIEFIRQGEVDYYSEIIRRYQIKLSHYLKKFIATNDELEDVLQDVFIKVYKNLNQFNSRLKFSSWIYRIAHNEAINHLRKYRREKISLDEGEWELIDKKNDLIESLNSSITNVSLESVISKLKEKYRQPLILYFFEDRSYQEISDILMIPIGTVGTLINRAKIQLRKYLDRQKYE